MIPFQHNDGGRAAAGFKGDADDCVARAICIVSGMPYAEVYKTLADGNATQRVAKYNGRQAAMGKRTARHGIMTNRRWFQYQMREVWGFEWVPTMMIGKGCKVHLRADELPNGRIIVKLSKHYAAVIDRVLHDAYDCSRGGTRCVYGYWRLK